MRFLERLDDVVRLSQDLAVKRLSAANRDQIRQAYRSARRRLLLLDYDGTLVPFSIDRDAVPPDPQVARILKDLASDSANHVALVSGRSRGDLERWFGGIPITMIGEHGAWVRDRTDGEWRAIARHATTTLSGPSGAGTGSPHTAAYQASTSAQRRCRRSLSGTRTGSSSSRRSRSA